MLSLSGSISVRQRTFTATVSTPLGSVPKANGAQPHTAQNWWRMACRLKVYWLSAASGVFSRSAARGPNHSRKPLRAQCNCSHCARKGFLLWFVPRAALRLKTPEAALSQYTFNRHAIRHQFCAVCGCAPFAFGTDPKGVDTVAVNVRCLTEIDPDKLNITHYDGRSK